MFCCGVVWSGVQWYGVVWFNYTMVSCDLIDVQVCLVFNSGNSQGKYQAWGILGFLDEYLYEPLLAENLITVEILPRNSYSFASHAPEFTSSIACKKSCRSLWDGQGRWKGDRWLSFVPGELNIHDIDSKQGSFVIWSEFASKETCIKQTTPI